MSCFEDQSLTLGLGLPSSPKPNPKTTTMINQPTSNDVVLTDHPSLTLSLSGESFVQRPEMIVMNNKKIELLEQHHQQQQPCSAASSLSNSGGAAPTTTVVSVKRERETASSDDLDTERASSRASDEEEDGSGPITTTRKKLRLSKDQSALLEESFKQHSTLNPKQKQALADRLNLRPRQVEVWFQNRRARTKLKQTEVDCEYLKKCCETLTDENRRLQKELQELKALKMTQPLYMHLPAATLTMCPSCERIGAGGVPAIAAAGGPATSAKSPFSMAAKPHFYSSFPNPSAAC